MELSEKDNKACTDFPLASEILYCLYEAYEKSYYAHFFQVLGEMFVPFMVKYVIFFHVFG